MSTHKLFVANGVFPRFNSTASKFRNFSSRADDIADLVKKSGADCAVFNELGKPECATLAESLKGWQYDRAQGIPPYGNSREGLNSVWTKKSVWNQPEDGLIDVNMPSGTEWVRTLLLASLTEVADPTAHVYLGAFHETLAQAAGLAYVKKMVDTVGNKRVILAGDFKRTGDSDDLAYMKKSGFVVHERVSATPMVCFTKRNVTVSDVDHVSKPSVFDHEYLIVTFSIPNQDVPDPA